MAILLAACADEVPGPNRPPVARAGQDLDTVIGARVQLDAGSSYDPDGDPLGFVWQLVAVPAGGDWVLTDAQQAKVVLSPDKTGVWLLRLTVTDLAGARATDVAAVSVFGCLADEDCGDGFLCTDDRCVAGVCASTVNQGLCPDDGLFCNGQELCRPGDLDADAVTGCLAGGNPCPPSDCAECDEPSASCRPTPGLACDDGDVCTQGDLCSEDGNCTPGPDRKDSDGDSHSDSLCGGDDCDDSDADVHPGVTEGPVCDLAASCFDQLDNDCDGATDGADGDCQSAGFICVQGPESVTVGSQAALTVRLDAAGYDPANIVCYTDDTRLRLPTRLFGNDFDSNLAGFDLSGDVFRDWQAQSSLSSGSEGAVLWGAQASMESQTIDTTGYTRIGLRYSANATLFEGLFDPLEFLITEYSYDGGVQWFVLDMVGDGILEEWQWYTHILPESCANVSELKIRFRTLAADSNEDAAAIDDVSVLAYPEPTVSRTLYRNHFEVSEGNSQADICVGKTVLLFDDFSSYSKTCLVGEAQNPVSAGSQGLRLAGSDTVARANDLDTRYVPTSSQLLASFVFLSANLPPPPDEAYAHVLYRAQDQNWHRMAGVGLDTMVDSTQDPLVRFLLDPDALGQGDVDVTVWIPGAADDVEDQHQVFFDDFELSWTRASHDEIGDFSDVGEGSYVATLQSDLAGPAQVTCIYYGVDPPLITDGSNHNSGPAPVEVVP